MWVEFDWGTEIFRARQTVAEKLQIVAGTLPPGVSAPVLAPVSSVMGEIMMVGLTWGDSAPAQGGPPPGEGTAAMALRTAADWTVRRRLLAVPGVAQVVPIGGEVKQYQVLADPVRMLTHGVTLEEVVRAAEGSNENASGGVFMDRGQDSGAPESPSVTDVQSKMAETASAGIAPSERPWEPVLKISRIDDPLPAWENRQL